MKRQQNLVRYTNLLKIAKLASIQQLDRGILLQSELGVIELPGVEIQELVSEVESMLDGTNSYQQILEKMPPDLYEIVRDLLDLLIRQGLVECTPVTLINRHRTLGENWNNQTRLFAAWGLDPVAARLMLSQSSILVVGLEPWSVVAAIESAKSGLGRVHAVDDQVVTNEDLYYITAWGYELINTPRHLALSHTLAKVAPTCATSSEAKMDIESISKLVCNNNWDLVIICYTDFSLHYIFKISAMAYDSGIPTLFAGLRGLSGHIGPLMRGGTMVCWNCYNSRFQANDTHRSSNRLSSTHPPEDISVGTCGRSYLGLSPMLQVLGHQLAIEVIKSIVSTSDSVLGNGVLVTDLVNLSTQIHKVVPFPWCEICGGPKQPGLSNPELLAQLASGNNVIRVSNLLPGWIDPTTGVISRISIRSQEQGDPVVPICADAITWRPRSHLPERTRHDLSSGKGRTIGQALISTLAEAIERYSAATINSRILFYGTIDEVPGTTFDVKTLCLYEDWQYKQPGFPFSRFDPVKPHYWVEGLWADTHESIWVPALVAYFAHPWANEESFCQVTSSGLAAGGNFDDAALRAFYELIERDAFMLTWLTNGRPRKIDSNAIDIPYVNLLIQELQGNNIDVELFLLDVGTLLPVVVALGLGNGVSIPSATVGLGAHPVISTSIAKALEELSCTIIGLRRAIAAGEIKIPEEPKDISSFVEHGLYYVPKNRLSAFEDFRSGEEVTITEVIEMFRHDYSAKSHYCQLAEMNIRVAFIDVTSPDVLLSPFRVVRAVGTNLQMIHCGFGVERLNNPRLWAMGIKEINRNPHPLT